MCFQHRYGMGQWYRQLSVKEREWVMVLLGFRVTMVLLTAQDKRRWLLSSLNSQIIHLKISKKDPCSWWGIFLNTLFKRILNKIELKKYKCAQVLKQFHTKVPPFFHIILYFIWIDAYFCSPYTQLFCNTIFYIFWLIFPDFDKTVGGQGL